MLRCFSFTKRRLRCAILSLAIVLSRLNRAWHPVWHHRRKAAASLSPAQPETDGSSLKPLYSSSML